MFLYSNTYCSHLYIIAGGCEVICRFLYIVADAAISLHITYIGTNYYLIGEIDFKLQFNFERATSFSIIYS